MTRLKLNTESYNSSFGQNGSFLMKSTSTAVTLTGRNGVITAIAILEDNTTFASSNGLVAEDATKFVNTESQPTVGGLSGTTSSTVVGEVLDSYEFPKGCILYGRWTKVDLSAGSCICYVD